MKKIIIIGCPGAGKSTFAKALHNKLGLPLYHLDMIWHNPDRTNITREEFDARLCDIFKKDEWIIDGNYNRTLEIRFKECDTVFFLDLSTDVCVESVRSRIGKPRDDMPWAEDDFDPEFLEYIKNFPKDMLPKIYELLAEYKNKNIVVFNTRKQVNEYLENM